MKYSTVLLSLAIGAFALPQEASVTSAPATTGTVELTPQQTCLATCDDSDVTCRAACLGVARPNSSQAVETNECAAKCDQGDGSPEQSQKFSDCVQACIYSLFPSTQTVGGPAVASSAAGTEASATGSTDPANSTGSPSGTGSEATGTDASGSPTGTGAQASGTGAANANKAHLAGYGLAGLLAVFAL